MVNIREVDALVEEGIFDDKEREEFLKGLTIHDDGTLTGVMTNNNGLWVKYGYGKLPSEDEPLWKYVYNNIHPTLGAENHFPLFKKYGMTICGICDDWLWFTSDKITDYARKNGCAPIDEAPELDLWKIIALCEKYWRLQYERWYQERISK